MFVLTPVSGTRQRTSRESLAISHPHAFKRALRRQRDSYRLNLNALTQLSDLSTALTLSKRMRSIASQRKAFVKSLSRKMEE